MLPYGFERKGSKTTRRIGPVKWVLDDRGAHHHSPRLLARVQMDGSWSVVDLDGLVLGGGQALPHMDRCLFDRGLREASQTIGSLKGSAVDFAAVVL